MKQRSGEWGELWGWKEGCRSQSYTLDLIQFESYMKAGVLPCYRVKIPPLLHVGWISTDLQADSWNWEASGDSGVDVPAFCKTEVSNHSWAFHPLNWGVTDPWKGVGAEQKALEPSLFRHRLLRSIIVYLYSVHHSQFRGFFVWKQWAGKIAVSIPSGVVLGEKRFLFLMENVDFITQNLKILVENCESLSQCDFLFSNKNKIAEMEVESFCFQSEGNFPFLTVQIAGSL